MSYDQSGEWGLRFRLRWALASGWSYASAAAALGISEATLRAYMADSSYILSEADYQAVLTNLPSLAGVSAHTDERITPNGVHLFYVESPYWTSEQLDNLAIPDDSTYFRVIFLAASAGHRPSSTRMYALDTFEPAEMALDACEGQLDRLIGFIFYAYAEPLRQ